MRRSLAAGAAVLAVVAAGAVLRVREPAATATPAAAPRVVTERVRRTDLVVTEDVRGTAGYAGSYAVANRLAGTLTSVAAPGTVVTRGGALFAVDAVAVRLLYGRVPAYRTLATGTEGADVRQLEANLAALGWFAGPPDAEFDSATARAVRAWQRSAGGAETGRVELGHVVFAAGALRVTEVSAAVGAAVAPGPLLEASGTARVVRVDLPVAAAGLVRRGATVTVEPPAGAALRGTVTSVGTVATAPEGGGDPTVEMLVTLRGKPRVLDGSPVTVSLSGESRRGVLVVPVEALLALREGGFAVEVPGRGLVAVETGLFADGLVEVTGVADGTPVVVPG